MAIRVFRCRGSGAGYVLICAALLIGCDDGHRARVEPGDGLDAAVADGGISLDARSPLGDAAPPDARTPEPAEPDAAEPDAAQPDAAQPDTSPPDASPPDAGPPPTCRVEVETIETAAVPDFEPLVDGDEVYFTALGPQGTARTVRLSDRAPVGGPSDRLLAIRDGAALLLRPDGAGTQRLIYRDGAGDTPLGDGYDPYFPIHPREVEWRPPTWVQPGEAVFLRGGSAWHWRRGEEITREDDDITDLVLDDDRRIMLRRHDDPPRLRLVYDGERRVVRAFGQFTPVPGSLRAGPDGVWALAEEGPVLFRSVVRDTVTSAGGPDCRALDADGDEAVAVCADGEDDVLRWFSSGGASRELARAPLIAGARLVGDRVAYATWDDREVWCGAGPQPGALYWARLDDPEPAPIAEIYAGCLCCGAYWPWLTLEASDTVLAWNYPSSARDQRAGLGVARLICD